MKVGGAGGGGEVNQRRLEPLQTFCYGVFAVNMIWILEYRNGSDWEQFLGAFFAKNPFICILYGYM